jgi:hypothetical protein
MQQRAQQEISAVQWPTRRMPIAFHINGSNQSYLQHTTSTAPKLGLPRSYSCRPYRSLRIIPLPIGQAGSCLDLDFGDALRSHLTVTAAVSPAAGRLEPRHVSGFRECLPLWTALSPCEVISSMGTRQWRQTMEMTSCHLPIGMVPLHASSLLMQCGNGDSPIAPLRMGSFQIDWGPCDQPATHNSGSGGRGEGQAT